MILKIQKKLLELRISKLEYMVPYSSLILDQFLIYLITTELKIESNLQDSILKISVKRFWIS